MGKTISTVLGVAAIAALVVVTAGAAAGVLAGVSVAASIEASVAGLGILTGLGATVAGAAALAGASILANEVLGPKLPKPDTTVTPLKSALAPRVRAYGRSRLYGNYVLYVTSPSGVAIDVYSYVDTGGNAIDAVETLYLGDQIVAHSAGTVPGLADGSYGGVVNIDFRLGHATETVMGGVASALPTVWTSGHRGDGVVTASVLWQPVKAKDYQKRYPNGQPSLSMISRWLRVYDWRDSTQSLTNPATWKWSENAVLHLADYVLTVEKAARATDEMFPSGPALQAAWNRYFAPTLAYWTAAANDCDTARALKAGGTEKRYRGLVSHKLTDPHKAVKTRILTCFDGWLAPREDGALIVYSGRYYVPTVPLGPDEIVSYSLQSGVEDESAVNDIAVTYNSPLHDFGTVDTDNWSDELDISTRGALRSESFSPDVPSHAQARALAKRKMIQTMAPQRGTCVTNSGGRAARGERFIHLTLREAGRTFYDGPVEITQMTRNLATGGVSFTWIAATPTIDSWIPALEEGNPAPVGTTPAVGALPAPTITSATADYSDVGQTPDGTLDPGDTVSGARVLIVASGPADRTDLTWYARWRVGASGIWNESEYADSDPGSGVTILTGFVPLVSNLQVEVAYVVGDGRGSDWSDPASVDTTIS